MEGVHRALGCGGEAILDEKHMHGSRQETSHDQPPLKPSWCMSGYYIKAVFMAVYVVMLPCH